MDAGALLHHTRRRAGLTQAELARRAGTTQSAVARIERPGSNPRFHTVHRLLGAAGYDLELAVRPRASALDEDQIRRHLHLTPAERARAHDAAYEATRDLVRRARRVDG